MLNTMIFKTTIYLVFSEISLVCEDLWSMFWKKSLFDNLSEIEMCHLPVISIYGYWR